MLAQTSRPLKFMNIWKGKIPIVRPLPSLSLSLSFPLNSRFALQQIVTENRLCRVNSLSKFRGRLHETFDSTAINNRETETDREERENRKTETEGVIWEEGSREG